MCAEKKESGKSYSQQTMLLGTHTSEGEQNYLMLAEVQLPFEDTELDARQYDDERGEVGGFGAANGKVSSSHRHAVSPTTPLSASPSVHPTCGVAGSSRAADKP